MYWSVSLYYLCMPLLPLPVHFPNSNIPPYSPMAPIHPPLNRQESQEPINITQNIKDIKHSQHTKFTIHKMTNSQTDKVERSNKVIK